MPKSKAGEVADQEALTAVQRLRDLAPPDFVLLIYRYTVGQREPAWLADWSGDEIPTEAQIAEKFGGGDYRLELRDGERHYIKGGSARLRIAGAPKDTAPAPAAGGQVDPTVKYAFDMLERIQKDQAATRAQARPVDIPALITASAAFMTALGAIFAKRDGGGMDVAKLREIVALGRELTPEPAAPSVESDGSMWGTVMSGLTKLAEVVQTEMHQRRLGPGAPDAGPGAAAPAAPEPAPGGKPGAGADAPAPAAAVAAGAPEWIPALQPFVGELVTLAADDADPALYADVILDQLERRQPLVLDFLGAKLARDSGAAANFQREFLQYLPATQPYGPWFSQLFAAMRDSILEAQKQDAADQAAGVDQDAGTQPAEPPAP